MRSCCFASSAILDGRRWVSLVQQFRHCCPAWGKLVFFEGLGYERGHDDFSFLCRGPENRPADLRGSPDDRLDGSPLPIFPPADQPQRAALYRDGGGGCDHPWDRASGCCRSTRRSIRWRFSLAARIRRSWCGQWRSLRRYGYDEINLNVGCPSDRVQSGTFGACLMLTPETVAACIAAMKA